MPDTIPDLVPTTLPFRWERRGPDGWHSPPGGRRSRVASFLSTAAQEGTAAVLPTFFVGTLRATPLALGAVEAGGHAAGTVARMVGAELGLRTHRRRALSVIGHGGITVGSALVALATSEWAAGIPRAASWAARGLRTPLVALGLLSVLGVRSTIMIMTVPGMIAVAISVFGPARRGPSQAAPPARSASGSTSCARGPSAACCSVSCCTRCRTSGPSCCCRARPGSPRTEQGPSARPSSSPRSTSSTTCRQLWPRRRRAPPPTSGAPGS
jgi:hypothetical protein